MLFNSLDFAIFLPIVFILYWYICRGQKAKNALLLIASYVFYGWWDWRFLSLIVISSLVDYWVGLSLSRVEAPRERKALLGISLLVNLGFLGFFKYYNFFTDSFSDAFSFFGFTINTGSLYIILPVGISFYTFQTMSYTLDIYHRKIQSTNNPIAFFAFVSFFPQLVAGPIERASHLLPQFLKSAQFEYEKALWGIRQMLWGLFMKVAVADRLSIYVDAVYNNAEMHTGLSCSLATVFFAFQIYCDFAGYSLMAIGCAKLFGFELMDNFRRPYFSSSFKTFWSRWHISLSTWFRDYVYIPLGGSRVGPKRRNFNLFATFVVSGLWHGANWTFVIWGAIHGFYQIIEKQLLNRVKVRVPKLIQVLLVFFFTCLAWIFFRATSLSEAITILNKIFTAPGNHIHLGDLGIMAFSIMSLGILLLADWLDEYYPKIEILSHPSPIVRWSSQLGLIVYIVSFGVFDGSQFIYFQF